MVGTANGELGRDGATRTRSAAAATEHATGAGAGPAADVAVGPAGTEAGDTAGAVAGGAAGEGPGHGLLVHHRFDQNGAGEDAEAGGELSQHHRNHL